jgi:TatD DNase family protein
MPASVPYIDLHTHRHKHDPEVVSIVSLELEQTLFQPVYPRYCSVGRHPWQATAAWSEENAAILEKAQQQVECIAIGEVGLDRLQGPDLGLQRAVLIEQLDVAVAKDLPVILHCVRAHADLMQLRKQRGDGNAWIIHGFTGHGELAGQLLRQGFMLSFGEALLSTGAKVREALTHVPMDRMFFETDEGTADIQVIYRTASDVLGLPLKRLRSVVHENFQRCFGVDV